MLLRSIKDVALKLLTDALHTSITLFKIIVPISLATRFLQHWGIVDHLGEFLAPLMELVGLPGPVALVWASAMVTNIYGGLVVFASLGPELELTVAQVSVLGTMILLAHGLPVEALIARRAGARLWATLTVRIMGALLIGWLLNNIYLASGYLQQPNRTVLTPPAVEATWNAWVLAELRNMVLIFLVILALLTLLAIFRKIGVINLISKLLAPLLNLLGISREAAPVTIIGMTLGLAYGGGLIIREAESGKLSARDLFASITLMGLCHSIIEDTMLVMIMGSHISAVFWFRILFSLVFIYLLMKLVDLLPLRLVNKFLLQPVGSSRSAGEKMKSR